LAAGYYPEELPPPFNSRDLAKYRDSLLGDFSNIPKSKNGKEWYFSYYSSPSTIYFPQFGRHDRKHHIINPVNFFYISKELADCWIQIRKLLNASKLSASSLVFNWTAGRSLLKMDFEQRNRRIANISVRNSMLLVSDIARFYHSIYTHALAWAIHTKPVAKKDHSLSLLGNRLDTLSRNAQDGQTIGIPVGPDTSRVLAELVGVAIDRDLKDAENLNSGDAMRFVDDIVIGCPSREAGERLKSSLRRIVHSYELEINEQKTEIRGALGLNYSSWRHEIAAVLPGFGAKPDKLELYFDRVKFISNQNPGENVLRYALKISRAVFTFASEWKVIEDYLLLTYRVNSTTLPTIVEIIVNRNKEKGDIDKDKLLAFIHSNMPRLCEMDKHGELSWILFLASELSLQIRVKYLHPVFALANPVSALQVCHLASKSLVDKPIDRSYWNSFLTPEGLVSEMWLYSVAVLL
jgi:hypothetical protein